MYFLHSHHHYHYCYRLRTCCIFFQIVDQYLPDSHVFLGGVFIEVSWHSWVRHMLTSYPLQVASRTHTCLLHLLIKLANEPNVRQVNVKDLYVLPLKRYDTGSLHLLGFWSVCLSVCHLNFDLTLFSKKHCSISSSA